MASDFEVLILIPTASQAAANLSSACWKPPPDEANNIKSSAKGRDVILKIPLWFLINVGRFWKCEMF